MTLRVFETFAGIGSQRMVLRNLGIPHEVVAISEIDKFAIKSYEAIHGETYNIGDISQMAIENIPDHDLLTYSFPCQDISNAGGRKGFEKGSGTRSSLLWECEKIIKYKRPKYLLLENVKALVNKKNKEHFNTWLSLLNSYGYTNYWEVLNAKDYGVPQNRERVFVVSFLGSHDLFDFPGKKVLNLRLKDILESKVDEKFYLSKEQVERMHKVTYNKAVSRLQQKNYCDTLLAGDYKSPKIIDEARFRKLTPKEYWRLMGFSDEDYNKASQVNSNSQLYKQAGNSIVVNVLEAIFKEMFIKETDLNAGC